MVDSLAKEDCIYKVGQNVQEYLVKLNASINTG